MKFWIALFAAVMLNGMANAAEQSKKLIWGNIPMLKGANYFEFNAELSKTRAQARGELLNEFASLLIPLAGSSDDMVRLAQVLASTIARFDSLARQHAQDAHDGVPAALADDFRSGVDRILQEHRLSDGEQRTGFAYTSKEELNAATQKRMPIAQALKLIHELRFFAYGSYSVVDRGVVRVTLNLEDLSNSRVKVFSAQGSVEEVGARLATKVVDFLQGTEYPEWENPQPHLIWIAPAFPQTKVRAELATRYCQGQNARIPYAVELLQAAMAGPYRKGGVGPLIKDSTYIVADRNRYDEQYYYSTREDAQIQTGGPLHTSAGHGTVTGYYWCVRGEPSKDTLFDQAIYRLLRENRARKRMDVAFALEYLLASRNDLAAEPQGRSPSDKTYEETFPTLQDAVQYLAENGVYVRAP